MGLLNITSFFIIAVYLMVVAAANLKTGPEVRQIFEDCKNEIGYTGTMKSIQPLNPTTQEKCFVRCVFERNGVLRSDGSIDTEVHKAFLSALPMMRNNEEFKARAPIAIDECAAQLTPIPDDFCETAYQYFDCMRTRVGAR